MMRKLILGMSLFIFLLTGMMFAVSIISIEATKEMRSQDNGVMQTPSGDVVKVGSSDLTVSGDGTLVKSSGACPSTSRRLQDATSTSNDNSIKTTPSLSKFALASHLPDSMLMALDEFVVYSDKGHSLHIKVHGFARIPVLNSRCGNVVHFYTAWNGKIILDSTDLSFDDATSKQFEGAGFDIAVGGGSTRRLAGTSTSDGFFKHIAGMEDSGEWTCGDVPLPQIAKTHSFKESVRSPCSAPRDASDANNGPLLCDSSFGGAVYGASKISYSNYLATLGKASRMRQTLAGTTKEPVYSLTESTVMNSAGYRLQLDTYPTHPGQTLVTLTNKDSRDSVTFQIFNNSRHRCEVESFNWVASMEDGEADENVDSEMHFEFMGVVEEDGQSLRHFRMMPDSAFLEYMGGQSANTRPTDAYTEYWDFAETLSPYRILSGDGTMTLFTDYNNTASDDQVLTALSAILPSKAFADLWACTSQEANRDTTTIPEMKGPYVDLSADAVTFYTQAMTNSSSSVDSWEQVSNKAADVTDTSDKAEFFRYLLRVKNPYAMPDFCYVQCKSAMDALSAYSAGDDEDAECTYLTAAMQCVQSVGISRCSESAFVLNHVEDACANIFVTDDDSSNTADNSRRLAKLDDIPSAVAADPVKKRSQVPHTMLKDGTTVIDLETAPRQLQDAVSQHTKWEHGTPGRILFNVTDDAEQSVPTQAVIETAGQARKLFFQHKCPDNKNGQIQRLSGAWCIKWDIDVKGAGEFSLELMWGYLSGYAGLSITCEGCVEILSVFAIPKPLSVSMCVGGNLIVSASPTCGLPISFYGKVYFKIEGGIDLGIVEIIIAQLEIGVQATTKDYEHNCVTYTPSERRRRRRRNRWSRRRRTYTQCDSACDILVGGYASLMLGPAKAVLEMNYMVKHKELTFDTYVQVYEFWKLWWGGWWTAYSTQIAKYNF